jgi:hypothetical protein
VCSGRPDREILPACATSTVIVRSDCLGVSRLEDAAFGPLVAIVACPDGTSGERAVTARMGHNAETLVKTMAICAGSQ